MTRSIVLYEGVELSEVWFIKKKPHRLSMRRRTYLTVAVGTIPLAGCSETATDPANGGNGDGGGGDESTSEQSEESNGSAESEPEPEPEPEFEVRSVNAPEEVELGEEWSYSMTVANTGDADGTYTGVVEIDSPAFQQPETSEFSSDITAGEDITISPRGTPQTRYGAPPSDPGLR